MRILQLIFWESISLTQYIKILKHKLLLKIKIPQFCKFKRHKFPTFQAGAYNFTTLIKSLIGISYSVTTASPPLNCWLAANWIFLGENNFAITLMNLLLFFACQSTTGIIMSDRPSRLRTSDSHNSRHENHYQYLPTPSRLYETLLYYTYVSHTYPLLHLQCTVSNFPDFSRR